MPEKTAEAWRNGWFHTGDAFRHDEDGWYYFVDRMKDTIRRRGENISTFEVETVVREHPDVAECAAIGVPADARRGRRHGRGRRRRAGDTFDPAALLEWLQPRMPKFMLPRYVDVVADSPATPTTQRVKKFELRARGVTATHLGSNA